MPREYEAIRDSLVAEGKDYDEAQGIAAATYNKRRPDKPMHGRSGNHKRPQRRKTTPKILSYGRRSK